MKHSMRRFVFGSMVAWFFAGSQFAKAADFQYSVPIAGDEERTAFLWIPPECKQVRGIFFCLNNMLEEHIVLDPTIRQTLADLDFGIVWVHPGNSKTQPLDGVMRNGDPTDQLEQVLKDLAKESGYEEIEFSPLIVSQHSAASPFGYGIQRQMPERIIAAIPIKGWFPGWKVFGIPNLQITSEGDPSEPARWKDVDMPSVAKYRAQDERCLMGEMVDIGSTHFLFTPASAEPVAMFIRKVVEARLPKNAPRNRPPKLKEIDPGSGWLISPDKLGTPEGIPVLASKWEGNSVEAFWYIDEEMARTANDYMLDQLKKKKQMIQAIENGKLLDPDTTLKAEIHPVFEADGATFKVAATWRETAPDGTPLGHTDKPIQFCVSSGALEQIGPDTFRVGIHRGTILNQGNPWEPHITAYSDGDGEYRRFQRPMHIWIPLIRDKGEPQTLDFPPIPDQKTSGLKPIQLGAKASSGLPVQYFVVSGPVTIEEGVLRFDRIPPRTKFPMRVKIAAYQWGRATDPQIQTAGPITREFLIAK